MGKRLPVTEFAAMQQIGKCLKDLNTQEKERVLAWAITYLEVEKHNLEKARAEKHWEDHGKKNRPGFDSAEIGDPRSARQDTGYYDKK